MKKTLKMSAIAALLSCVSVSAAAADMEIQVTNLTQGIYFTPLMVAAHDSDAQLFTSGSAASASVQEMAEGGGLTGLTADLTAANATFVANPAGGLLAPGASTTTELNTDDAAANTQLSVVAMMLPTNDGFIALNNITIPTEAGTYRYNLNAYDAGTEANDEIRGSGAPGVAGFPAPGPVDTASGSNGTGITASAEGFVHIHRGVLGDTDSTGGVSDIDSTTHRWLNPVARVTVIVK